MTHTSENQDIVLERGDPGQDENRKPWYRHWWVALIGLVVVAGVIGASVAYANAQSLSRSRVAYQEAVDQARQAFDELDGVVAQAQDLVAECASKTGDDASCDGLAEALKDLPVAEQFASGRDLGRAELEAGKVDAEKATKVARERAGLLSEHSEAVRAAVGAFELNSAKEALADAIEQATTARDQAVELIGQTEGKVVDDDKRGDLQRVVDELSGLIDEAGQVSGQEVQAYRDMVAQLDQLVASLDEPVAQVEATYQAFLAQSPSAASTGGGQSGASAGGTASLGGTAPRASQPAQGGNNPAPAPKPAPAQAPAPAPAPAPKPAAPTLSRMDWACVGTTDGRPSKCRAECYDESGAPYYGPLYGLTTEAGVPVTQCWGPYV